MSQKPTNKFFIATLLLICTGTFFGCKNSNELDQEDLNQDEQVTETQLEDNTTATPLHDTELFTDQEKGLKFSTFAACKELFEIKKIADNPLSDYEITVKDYQGQWMLYKIYTEEDYNKLTDTPPGKPDIIFSFKEADDKVLHFTRWNPQDTPILEAPDCEDIDSVKVETIDPAKMILPSAESPENTDQQPIAEQPPANPTTEPPAPAFNSEFINASKAQYLDLDWNTFNEIIGKKAIVLFFHVDWYPACTTIHENISTGIHDFPENTKIFKTNFDTEKDLRKKFDIDVQCTVVVVDKNGAVSDRLIEPTNETLIEAIKQTI